jgi:hypothetical protein
VNRNKKKDFLCTKDRVQGCNSHLNLAGLCLVLIYDARKECFIMNFYPLESVIYLIFVFLWLLSFYISLILYFDRQTLVVFINKCIEENN